MFFENYNELNSETIMRSKGNKTIIALQVVTLILVAILLIRSFSGTETKSSKTNAKEISTNKSVNHFPNVDTRNNYVFGEVSAANYLTVFSRYNCGYCRYFYTNAFDSLQEGYIKNGKLKVICKDLVGQEDEMGLLMAKVAEVARQTNHYPAVHRLLFTETEAADSSALMLLAIAGGIPEKDLSIRLNSSETLRKIEADYNEAKRLDIAGTPSYVLNGKLYVGLMSYTDIDSLLTQKIPGAENCDVQ